MVAFDLLYLNGYDLRKLPLSKRKAPLKRLLDGTDIQIKGRDWEILNGTCLALSGTAWKDDLEFCRTLSHVAEPEVVFPGVATRALVRRKLIE
jgi:hypothetical protein